MHMTVGHIQVNQACLIMFSDHKQSSQLNACLESTKISLILHLLVTKWLDIPDIIAWKAQLRSHVLVGEQLIKNACKNGLLRSERHQL